MGTVRWIGNAPAVAQVNTLTPTASNSQTYTITINGKAVTYTADGSATVAEITAGLVAAFQAASLWEEFSELTAEDGTTVVTITANTPGKPFTQTSGATGGGALVTSTTTASRGPNHWADILNWDTGTIPVDADDVDIRDSNVDILYDLDQHTIQPATLNIPASYTGRIGLPNYDGTYYDYRDKYLRLGAAVVTIGSGDGDGSGRIKLDTGTDQTAITVYGASSPVDPGLPALIFKGTHASNVLTVYRGSAGVALEAGNTSTIATLKVGYEDNQASDASVFCSSGVTLTTIQQVGGSLTINSAFTTLTKSAGSTIIRGTGAVTTLTLEGGDLSYESSGTATTLTVGTGASITFERDLRSKTVTNATVWSGYTLIDRYRVVTFTNGVKFSHCGIGDGTLDLGEHLTLTPAVF